MKKYLIISISSLFLACNQKATTSSTETTQTSVTSAQNEGHNHPKISEMISNPVTAHQEEVDPKKAAVMEFEHKLFEFGRVKAGEIVKHEFKFKNTGKNPLVIKDAQGSCGCTVAEYPKEPVPPGGTGVIKASFNTEGRNSYQAKYITLYANTIPSETKLALEGEVYEK